MTIREPRPHLLIRRAHPGDLDQIVAIERVSFPTPWSDELLRSEIERQNGLYLVAESSGRTIGYLGMWYYARQGHISTLAVHPEWRGRGVGEVLVLTALFGAAEQGARFVELEYRISNRPAQRLYRKMGFQTVGRRPLYYEDTDEDAVLAAFAGLQTDRRRTALRVQQETWERERGFELVVDL